MWNQKARVKAPLGSPAEPSNGVRGIAHWVLQVGCKVNGQVKGGRQINKGGLGGRRGATGQEDCSTKGLRTLRQIERLQFEWGLETSEDFSDATDVGTQPPSDPPQYEDVTSSSQMSQPSLNK